MLKFSANLSLLFTELPLLERFAAAKQNGFDAVEIQFPYDVSAEQLRQAADAAQVRIVLINVPAGDLMSGGAGLACHPDKSDEFREAVRQALHYADVLNVECINVLAGRLANGYDEEQCFARLVENLRYCAEQFEPLRVKVLTEAINRFDMPDFLLSSFEAMQDAVRAAAHPNLALQFDIYHMTRTGEDVASRLRDHYAEIGHIQFADAPGRGAPGTGEIDFAELFMLIEALPYNGWCGAEYKPTVTTEKSLSWRHAYDLLL
ncbi:MAG TPA: TIM barrel protein [Pseudomonadales bacterium]|nr:TIM barrel protein [Pseudomonadales bacterium]